MPFAVAAGATTGQLVDRQGNALSSATVSAIHRTDWQGRQLLYPTARTNRIYPSADLSTWYGTGGVVSSAISAIPGQTATSINSNNAYCNRYPRNAAFGGYTNKVSVVYILESVDALNTAISLYDASANQQIANGVITWATLSFTQSVGYDSGAQYTITNLGTGPNGGTLVACEITATPTLGNTIQAYFYPTNGRLVNESVIFHGCECEYADRTGAFIPTTTASVTVTDYTDNGDGTVGLGQAAATGDVYDWDGTSVA